MKSCIVLISLAALFGGSARVDAAANWWDLWTPVDWAEHFSLGDFNGRSNVYETHPASTDVPFRWLRTITATSTTNLHFEVSAKADDYATTDWVLKVVANGQTLVDQVIHGTGWQTFDVNLGAFAGQSVALELWNQANGWHWEVAYWDAVSINGEGGGTPTPTNHPPVPSITAPSNGDIFSAGQSVNFSGSATDADGDAVSYTWTSSIDGQLNTGTDFSRSDLSLGNHTITLQASDAATSASTSIGIVIWSGNHPPGVGVTSPTIGSQHVTGQNVHFSCYASDQDGDSLSYSWVSSRNGSIGSSSSFDTSGLSEGIHTVTVQVSDGHGNDASASVTITLIADADLDGLSDSWEELYGSDATSLDPNDDMDGDGYSNIAEYLAGTDPSDPDSVPGASGASGGVSCTAGGNSAAPGAALALFIAAVITLSRPRKTMLVGVGHS